MNTSDGLLLSRKEVRYSFIDRIGDVTVGTGERTGDDIPVLFFFHLEGKTAFTGRAAQDFYDFFFHDGIPYLVFS